MGIWLNYLVKPIIEVVFSRFAPNGWHPGNMAGGMHPRNMAGGRMLCVSSSFFLVYISEGFYKDEVQRASIRRLWLER